MVLEKKIFKGFYTIYGHGGHLGHVTWTKCINFRLPLPGGCAGNLTEISQVASEEKSFKIVDSMDYGRQRLPFYKLSGALGSGQLKSHT